MPSPRIISHRGHCQGGAPENTLASLTEALRRGFDGIEIDVHLTLDGEVILHHDHELNPRLVTDERGDGLSGAGPHIEKTTCAALRTFRVGRMRSADGASPADASDSEPVPLLSDALELLRRLSQTACLLVEMKTWGDNARALALAVTDAVNRTGLHERIRLLSFDWRALAAARSIAPTVRRHHLSSGIQPGATPATMLDEIAKSGGRAWAPHFKDLDRSLVIAAHDRGLEVSVWTVNEPDDIRRMCDLGVDELITDAPDVARDIISLLA